MANDLTGKKVAFLGAGKMGGIILQALLKNGLLSAKSTCATVAHEERAKALAAKLKVKVGTNNVDAVKGADIIVIGVKPQVVEEVVREISSHISAKQVIVSVAASVPTSMIEKNLAAKYPRDPRHAQYSVPAGSRDDRDLQRQARQRGGRGYDLPHV